MSPPVVARRFWAARFLAVLVLLPAVLLTAPAPAGAIVDPRERLEDPALEARARALSKDLRCLVCQNQSIDDSNAELAQDLRILVRERLLAGDSDDAALDFIVARYGDYVLLRPPIQANTYALWFGPALIFALGTVAAVLFLRRRAAGIDRSPDPLSDDERARIDALLARGTDADGPSDRPDPPAPARSEKAEP